METTVKKVGRAPELTLWERSYLPEILRGMSITLKHFFTNLAALAREFALAGGRKERTIATIYYPEEQPVVPAAYRGRPVLVQGADGLEKCVACGLCEAACPPHCISIVGSDRENGDRFPETYTLDGSRCIFCGRCEEVCPKEAIVMSGEWQNICEYDRSNMIYSKVTLLRSETSVAKRLDYLRTNAYAKERY